VKLKEVTIREDDDIAVVINDGGQDARIYVFQSGVRITAPVWDETQWGEYIKCRTSGQCSGPGLTEKEKEPPFFTAVTETDCSG